MRPQVIAASFFLFLFAQCVVIGALAVDSAWTHGELTRTQSALTDAKSENARIQTELAHVQRQAQAAREAGFYAGMYTLCWDAYQGYGYQQSEVNAACNSHVAKERGLMTHRRPAEGYSP